MRRHGCTSLIAGDFRRRGNIDSAPVLRAVQHEIAAVQRGGHEALANCHAVDDAWCIDVDEATVLIAADRWRTELRGIDAERRCVRGEPQAERLPYGVLERRISGRSGSPERRPGQRVADAGAGNERLREQQRSPTTGTEIVET